MKRRKAVLARFSLKHLPPIALLRPSCLEQALELILGSVGFILAASTTDFGRIDVMWWLGAAIALIASIAVVVSLAVPVGTRHDYDAKGGFGLARLFTWVLYT